MNRLTTNAIVEQLNVLIGLSGRIGHFIHVTGNLFVIGNVLTVVNWEKKRVLAQVQKKNSVTKLIVHIMVPGVPGNGMVPKWFVFGSVQTVKLDNLDVIHRVLRHSHALDDVNVMETGQIGKIRTGEYILVQ